MDACEQGSWHLEWGAAGTPEAWQVCPFKCGSWRHAGDCARYRSQLDYQRLKEALGKHPLEHCLFGVLTLDRKRNAGIPLNELYTGLVDRWTALAREVRKQWGRFEYHLSLEQHADGFPHLNLVLVSERIAEQLEQFPPTEWERKEKVAPHWWRDLTSACGFGYRVSLERVADKEAVASYATKLDAGRVKAPQAVGAEVVKLSQLPLAAPKRTRRIRSSKGFLPPIRKDPEVSGRLVRTPVPAAMALQQELELRQLAGHLQQTPPEQAELPQQCDRERADALRTFGWAEWLRGQVTTPTEARAEAARRLKSVPELEAAGAVEARPEREARRGQEAWRYEVDAFREAGRGTAVWLRLEPGTPGRETEEVQRRARDGTRVAEHFHEWTDKLEEYRVSYSWVHEEEAGSGAWTEPVWALDAGDAREVARELARQRGWRVEGFGNVERVREVS